MQEILVDQWWFMKSFLRFFFQHSRSEKARKIIPTWINYPRNWHIPSQKRCLITKSIGGYTFSWTWPFGTKFSSNKSSFQNGTEPSNFPQPLRKMEVERDVHPIFHHLPNLLFLGFHDNNFPEGIFWGKTSSRFRDLGILFRTTLWVRWTQDFKVLKTSGHQ